MGSMYTPNFTISSQLNNLIAQIEAARVRIDTASILPEQEIALRYKALVESAHSSTSIEGNPLNPHQVRQALAGELNRWEKSVIEVSNYKKAWDWVTINVNKSRPLDLAAVLELHAVVMQDLLPVAKTGQLRSGEIYIVDIEDQQETVRYTGPDYARLPALLADLFAWVSDQAETLHPVLLTGIFHYEFVSIHPFSDGNGRVTRLLVKYLLDQLGYNFRDSLVLDKYYWQNQLQYYEALRRAEHYDAQRIADLNPWLDYYVLGFFEVVHDLSAQINLCKHLQQSTAEIRLNQQEIQILDYLHQFRQINLQDMLDMDIPERTAQRRLKRLVDLQLIKKIGASKKTFYVLGR